MSETTNLKLFKHDDPSANTNSFDIEKALNENWDKLDENAGAVNKKIENIEQSIEEEKKKMQEYNDNAEILKEKVDLLESNLEDVKAFGENVEIDDALKYYTDNHKIYGKSVQETRELSQDSASGEKVTLENVDPSRSIDIYADGNNRQETTTGKQLFNKDGDLSYPNNTAYTNATVLLSDGTLKSNSNANSNASKGARLAGLKVNTIYTVKGKIKSMTHNVRIRVMGYSTNWKAIVEPIFTSIGDFKFTFNTSSEYSDFFLSFNGYYNDSTTITEAIFDEVMVYEGTDDIPYEKYTEEISSPNPKYKQDIEVIDGCNRFDLKKEDFSKVYGWAFTTQSNNITLKPNTQYTLRTNSTNGNDTINNCDILWGGSTPINYGVSSNNPKTITSDDNGNIPIYIRQTNIDNFFNGTNYIQITEGTEEKPYLPHGCVGMKFSGKNKFNVNGNIQQLSSSNYYTRVENNKVIIPYSNEYEQSALFESINVKGGKTYTISCKLEQGIARLAFRLYDINNSLISSTIEGVTYLDYYKGYYRHNVTKITFTSPIEAKYLRILTINSTTTNNEETILSEIQLEEGEGTTYEPYHEPKIVEIALNGNSIAKINDSIKDELSIYRNGKVILGKKTNRYIFTGNENWQSQTGNHIKVQNLYISIDNMKGTTSGGSCCCNIAKFSMFAGEQNDTNINICKPNAIGNNLLLDVSQELFPTINSFKQYLLQQYDNGTPVYVDYELATPQTIELPSINMPKLWEGTVNVELISNLSTNMNVSYNIVPAMPSLEARSDIESAGEKYNIFDKNARIITSGTTKENLDTGVRVIGTIDGQYRYCSIELGKKELLGKNITMQAKIQSSNQNVGLVSINFGNENSSAIKSINSFNKEYEKKVVSIPTEFPENCDRIYLILYANLNGTLKKGDYVDYKDLMVSIGSNEKPYVPYDIGAINIKQQNENLLNTFDYTYVNNDENITFKNGQFIFNGTWKKWLAELYSWNLTNYWAEANYGNYIDLSKKSANILKAGKYYLKIKYISGNISTNGRLRFTYRLDTNTTGKSLFIGEFKSNVKEGDIIKKIIEITEDTPFTLMTTMVRTEDTVYDNFTFTAILEKDEETENFEEHKEVNHQMILNKPLRGIKVTDSTKANYIDENGNYWITDYVADDGIHRKIGKEKLNITSQLLTLSNGNKAALITPTNKWKTYITGVKTSMFTKAIYADRASKDFGLTGTYYENEENFIIVGDKNDTVETMQEKYNGETLLYILNEETLEEFTEEERKSWNEFKKLKTFKGKNYINSTDKIQAGLEFSYKKDSRISTQKELEKCNERLNNIENLLNTTETSALLLDNLENELKKEVE